MKSDKLIDAIGMIDPKLLEKSEQSYKKRKWTRISAWTSAVAALLVVAILVGALFTGKPPLTDGGDDPTDGLGNGALEPPSDQFGENGYICDCIPDEVHYGGKRVPILVWEQGKEYLFTEKDASEELQQRVYLSNKDIEEDLGITIDVTFKTAVAGDENGNDLFQSIVDRDNDYEAVVCNPYFLAMLVAEGRLHDLNSQTFPMSEMWWYPTETYHWEIGERLFFIANNSSIQNILSSWVVFINRDMFGETGVASIEETVLMGEWTLEKMRQYSRHWATEASSNTANVGDEGNVYGLGIYNRTAMDAFLYSSRLASGVFSPCLGEDDRTLSDNTIEKISAFCGQIVELCNSPEVFIGTGKIGMEAANALGKANTAMLIAPWSEYKHLANEKAYTMVVMPKLDTDPNTPYYTVQTEEVEAWGIPNTATDTEIGGVLIEAISGAAYRTIAPAWFDDDFKYRYSTSDNGVKIFEVIRQTHTTDFVRAYSSLGSPYEAIRRVLDRSEGETVLENDFKNHSQDLKDQLSSLMQELNEIGELYDCTLYFQHNHQVIEVLKAPTHFETGLQIVECACGDRITEVIPAVAHFYQIRKCNADQHELICRGCGYVIYGNHSWHYDGNILDEATQKPIQKQYICSQCKETRLEDIPQDEPSAEDNGCHSVVSTPMCLMLLISLAGVALATKKKKY